MNSYRYLPWKNKTSVPNLITPNYIKDIILLSLSPSLLINAYLHPPSLYLSHHLSLSPINSLSPITSLSLSTSTITFLSLHLSRHLLFLFQNSFTIKLSIHFRVNQKENLYERDRGRDERERGDERKRSDSRWRGGEREREVGGMSLYSESF